MDPRWPARPATPADYDAFLRLFPELAVPDPTPDRARWEAEILPDMLLLEHAGVPIAYGWSKRFGEAAHVVHVVVDPAWRGRRVGGALMEAIAERLRAAGCRRWALNVKIDNVAALRLYQRCGMRQAYRATSFSLPWDRVAALPRESAPCEARAIEPGEDAELEAAFSILPGRLADFRGRGRVLVRLVDPERPSEPRVGLASFDPSFPGAFPFVVARPTLAAPLLEALRPHARPGDARISVVAERDPSLDAALRDVGATVSLELFHMEGELSAKS